MLAPVHEPRHHVLIGSSQRIRQVLKLVDKLGRCRWPVLLLGETGTGKEVVARAIHNVSPVGPFVPIDCSSLVGPLMESELFGHVRGSFTGAVGAKTGLIELADGGTAFFDEIGELPLDLQAKLLRVLQEKEFRPVGSLLQRRSDFRVIAATNRDLAKEVERGAFRRDLFYRLNVVNLKIAPLRDRKEDIPALIAHFLSRYGRNHSLTQETLEAMLSYDWPGNVRELENCIQHMVAINSGPLIHTIDMPSMLQNHVTSRRSQSMAVAAVTAGPPHYVAAGECSTEPRALPPTICPPIIPLMEMEKKAIIGALEYTKGDRAVAANLLGIGRTTLYRKLKEYQIAS
jgi:transcriptional regulator with PAS, ATPase and Fis domain